MEFDNLLTLIGNYAFPICCCIYLFWSATKEREAHKDEMNKMTEALQNNTKAIIELKGMLSLRESSLTAVSTRIGADLITCGGLRSPGREP